MTGNAPGECAVFGIDIGKTVFHVVGLDERGAPVQKAKVRRTTLLQFFERARPTVVAMEACPGSQWLARNGWRESSGTSVTMPISSRRRS